MWKPRKSGVYDFNADYRDFAYFNFLPSYADPLLGQGMVLDEQSFDTRRKIAALSLDIRPGHWWTPYFGWDHDSSSGHRRFGFCQRRQRTIPVPNTLRDSTDLYRGGVRFEKPRFHVTLEEGGTAFKSDQSLYQTPGSVNYGNFSAPIFGQTLDLTSLLAAYGIGGSSAYSKALLTANPTTWLDIYGQFLYSQPDTPTSTISRTDAGNLYLQSQILFYSSEQELITAAAQQPHTTGSLGAEIRPFKRVRIVESWMTDRLHDAGSSASLDTLLVAGRPSRSVRCSPPRWRPTTARSRSTSFIDADVQAHAARRLSLCLGRCELRLPAAGRPGEFGSGAAAAKHRSGLGHFPALARKSRLTGEFEGASSAAAFISAPAFTTIRRCGRRCTINRCNRSASRAISRC